MYSCREKSYFFIIVMRDGFIWDKVFNGPTEICRRQPLKNLK